MNANDTMKNGQPVEDFQQCAWEGQSMDPYSMTEPYECHEPATVHHLRADAPFCARHHQKFDAKFGGQFLWAPKYSGTVISQLLDLVDRRMEVIL